MFSKLWRWILYTGLPEIPKNLFVGLSTLVFGAFIWAVYQILIGGPNRLITELEALNFIKEAKIVWVRIDEYAAINPLRFYGTFVACAIPYPIWLTIRKFIGKIKRAKLFIEDLYTTVSRLGIHGFWPQDSKDDREKQWTELHNFALKPDNRILWICGATGWNTFALKTSPLRNCLSEFNGQIRILLLRPDSTYLKKRANSVGQRLISYENEVHDTLKYCARLYEQGKDIEVRLYDRKPIWKMIITGSILWTQHYKQGKHVQETPAATLYQTKTHDGFYTPLYCHFLEMWDSENVEFVNLDSGGSIGITVRLDNQTERTPHSSTPQSYPEAPLTQQ